MTAQAAYRPWVISFFLAILVVTAYNGYSFFENKVSENEPDNDNISSSFTWTGILGIIAALLPLMIVGRQVYLDAAKFNKYTIHVSVGVTLMIVGFLLYLAQRRRKGFIVVVSVLLGLAIQTHYFNGLRYQLDWHYQKDLWWQLTWRAPDLKDDTLLAAKHPSNITFSENYEIWAPANLIYRPNSTEVKISGEIINSETEGWFLRGIYNNKTFRDVIPVSRNFENTLILTIPNELSCLHIIDGNRLEDYQEDSQVKIIHPTSDIDQIIPDLPESISPPAEIFGPEPEHNWCYYYQKISLAMQRGDWKKAASLADKAAELGFEPYNRSELIPVFEAYVNQNRIDDARKTAKLIRKIPDLRHLYCSQDWNMNNEAAYGLICGSE